MEKTFSIIPHGSIYEAKGIDIGEALTNFAFDMDGDMNNYFYADDNPSVICPYDVNEAINEIKDYAATNRMTPYEALNSIEIRGLKIAEVAEIFNRVNTLTNKTKEA